MNPAARRWPASIQLAAKSLKLADMLMPRHLLDHSRERQPGSGGETKPDLWDGSTIASHSAH